MASAAATGPAVVPQSPLAKATGVDLLKRADLIFTGALFTIVLMLLVPLPPLMLDVMLALQLGISLLMLLIVIYVKDPPEFGGFPTMLLALTLFRLALNICSTRLILTKGEAGNVIESFGHFVIQGNYIVGFVVFLILVVINFVVITKGAGRIAEVSARFTLDALPGKQMAIDAELNAGIIDEATATARRQKIQKEADFYGAMDGASKFVRGDAIAGILITLVNIIGGFAIGVLSWPYALMSPFSHPFEALANFSSVWTKIKVLYQGDNIWSNEIPWHYAPVWILLTTPLFATIGTLAGVGLFRSVGKRFGILPSGILLFAGLFPLIYVVARHSILYDGWRHLLFLYPALLCFAVLGWITLEDKVKNIAWGKYAVYGILGVTALESTAFIARNAAYPYVYFNVLAGGMNKAYNHFETDYWGISVKQAIQWLEDQNILSPNMQDTVALVSTFSYNVDKELGDRYTGKVISRYARYYNRYDVRWDYGIFPTRFMKAEHLQSGKWPDSRTVHTINANGKPILAIVKNDNPAIFTAMEAIKANRFADAEVPLKEELARHPENELAWTALAQVYINSNRFAEAQQAADKAMEIVPRFANALFYKGLASYFAGDKNGAVGLLEDAVNQESNFSNAYYYLALIYGERNDANAAIQYVLKCIEANPRFKQGYELAAQLYDKMGDTQRATAYRNAAATL